MLHFWLLLSVWLCVLCDKAKNAAEIDCSLARSTLQDRKEMASDLENQIHGLQNKPSEAQETGGDPNSSSQMEETSAETPHDNSEADAEALTPRRSSVNQAAIEEIRDQLQKQLDRASRTRVVLSLFWLSLSCWFVCVCVCVVSFVGASAACSSA